MFCLNNSDTLEGIASVAAKVDYLIYGFVAGAPTRLASGQLSDSSTILYTAPSAAHVVSISFVNTHTSAVSIDFYIDPLNAGTPRRAISKTLVLQSGYSLYFDGQRCMMIDTSGGIVSGGNVSDEVYGVSWNGITSISPSKNAVYDQMQLKLDGPFATAAQITAGNPNLAIAPDQLALSSPTVVTIKATNLTDGYIPKHTSDAVGLTNSPIYTDGTNIGIGTATPGSKLVVYGDNERLVQRAATTGGISTVEAEANTYLSTPTYMGTAIVQNGASVAGTSYGLSNANLGILRFQNGSAGLIYSNSGPISIGTGANATPSLTVVTNGNVGIGQTNPSYRLEIGLDSAGKPGVGGLWTVVSDERIKKEIELADLDRCYEIIKSIPLKRFGWADGVYTEDQVKDRHNLGWIAQDVQKVFAKAVNVTSFTKAEKIPDGQEEYEEQDFTLKTVEKESTSIKIVDGKAIQVKKITSEEVKTLLFNNFNVFDENGDQVFSDEENTIPILHQVPKMITKTREKFRQEVIEDCLDLNSGQLNAALYGCVQALMAKIETLEAKLAGQ